MADLLTATKFRSFLPTTNLPNAGGFVTVYETGTTTKVAAGQLKDARSGSNLSNPVTLDANGEANIWLAPSSQYTVLVQDSDLVQLSSTDGISVDDLATFVYTGSDIAFTTGNVGIGAVATSDTLNVGGTITASSDVTLNGDLAVQASGKGIGVRASAVTDMMGTATLVAGTVTVANTGIRTNDKIFLTRATTGGTEGHLSYTIINATSFTINSSAGADTSNINWLVIDPLL